MDHNCKKCGSPVKETTLECPKCKTFDPIGRVAEEAKKKKEYHVQDFNKFSKKMRGELPLDA